jgi:pyrroloquinoline quinone (PQQ) biosynthesis protein C
MATVMSERPSATSGADWDTFLDQVREVVMSHPVVTHNEYCEWFARGEANREQVRDLLQQFSVFSNLFIVAQLLKTINAPSLSQARESCEILVNELGVVFNSGRTSPKDSSARTDADKDREGDPDLVSTEGTVDGGVYRFNARHFEWLIKVGEAVGMGFDDLGKRKFGREETLFFCDELARIYGSDDPDIAEGASFAVEHWAAAGFWKQLIAGLDAFRERECPDLRLAFFTWHDRVEDQHAAHTMDELKDAFGRPGFDQQRFLSGAAEMLNGVQTFWQGLEKHRHELEAVTA